MSFSQRLKDARARLGMKQDEIAAQSGVSYSVYQKYELGRSVPGGDAIAGLVRLGINANWLLTGEGPMLLTDLLSQQHTSMPLSPVGPRINVDALETIIEGTIKAMPKAAPEAVARQSVRFYLQCIEQELITPEGIGKGQLNAAA